MLGNFKQVTLLKVEKLGSHTFYFISDCMIFVSVVTESIEVFKTLRDL